MALISLRVGSRLRQRQGWPQRQKEATKETAHRAPELPVPEEDSQIARNAGLTKTARQERTWFRQMQRNEVEQESRCLHAPANSHRSRARSEIFTQCT